MFPPIETVLDDAPKWNIELPILSHQSLSKAQTNRIYLLKTSSQRYVLRLNNPNSKQLGIDRALEKTILKLLQPTGFVPTLRYSDPNQIYCLFDYIEGELWSDIPQKKRDIQSLNNCINCYQSAPLNTQPFNYLKHIDNYYEQLKQNNSITCQIEDKWLEARGQLESFLVNADYKPVICHHDLTPDNIIQTPKGAVILDWEYSNLGHPDFDRVYFMSLAPDFNQRLSSNSSWQLYIEQLNLFWTLLST